MPHPWRLGRQGVVQRQSYPVNGGDISVSTCKKSWWVLAGREWWISIPKGTCNCVAMN